MTALWKTVRIFISSTFRDMHAERDLLVHDVFLELKERCAKRRLHLIDVDLRWGVTEEEEKQGKVLEICLDEIERCRPFFIGLLGERYGWTPPKYDVPDEEQYHWVKELEGRDERPSVTALEIYHGVLRTASMQTRAFFYFRDPAFLTDSRFLKEVSTEKQKDFLAESDDAAKKLETLKDEIRKHSSVFEDYPCGYGGLDENGQVKLSDLEVFGERLLEELWEAITLEYPEDPTPPDEVEIERSYHEAFIEGRAQRFIGRLGVLEQLTTFADSENESALVVTGKAGCGKSAVLANFTREYSANNPETFVLAHFIGVSPGSTDIRRTLLRLCRELARRFNIRDEIPTEYYELRQAFGKFLEQATAQSKVLVVLDALNQLDESHYAHALDWLPHLLPNGLKVIVSTLDDSDCLEALSRRNFTPCDVGALTKVERREIVRQTLKTYRKYLEEKPENDQMGLLLSKHESDNPLYLTVACEELRVFGEFERVTERIEALPNAVESLFEQVLERIEEDHERVEPGKGRERVKDALSLLECARHGLLESEMLELLARDGEKHLPQAIWARLYRGLKFYLRPSGTDDVADDSDEGLLDFFHRQLAKAVWQRYLKDEAAEVATHKLLAKYFKRKADPADDKTWSGKYPRALSDLSHHLLAGILHDELFELARDESFLGAQASAFPEDPELQLQTLQNAITGAADIDDAAKMAEFVLTHAQRFVAMTDESPLDALLNGKLERAWRLADLYETEPGVLWHLLLAWNLKDAGRMDDAQATLERLRKTELSRFSDLGRGFASELLQQTFEVNKNLINEFRCLILHENEERLILIKSLTSIGDFAQAIEIARQIEKEVRRIEALSEIAIAQAQSGDRVSARKLFAEAIETANQIVYEWGIGQVLSTIAIAQAQAGELVDAVETTREIDDKTSEAMALAAIAKAHMERGEIDSARTLFAKAIDAAGEISFGFGASAAELGARARIHAQAGEFTEALETVQWIGDDWDTDRAYALNEIATLQAQNGEVERAFEITRQIVDDKTRSQTLIEIAKTQAQKGKRDFARSIFAQALQMVGYIDIEWFRTIALSTIANVLAQTGGKDYSNILFARATESANRINDPELKSKALSEVAKSEVQAGDVVAAMKIAHEIRYAWEREEALVEIIAAQARGGDVDEAKESARQIVGWNKHKGKALVEIARVLARGDAGYVTGNILHRATETARQIDPEELNGEAWCEIAKAQAHLGDIAPALATARQINDEAERAEALNVIARVQAQARDVDFARSILAEAQETADEMEFDLNQIRTLSEIAKTHLQIGDRDSACSLFVPLIENALQRDIRWFRAEELGAIARAEAEVGEFTNALETAWQIDRTESRDEALCEIAMAQAYSGLSEQALLTVQTLTTGHNKFLPDIAAAFVITGNKNCFTRMIGPCSYHLGAAYQVCGLLARLYPEQAKVVADVVPVS